MNVYLLDTSIASVAIRGDSALDKRLSALPRTDWCISAITRSELRYGVALRPQATRLSRIVEAFLAVARCEPWDAGCADAHGRLRASLARKGQRIGDFDEMIAAHALALRAILVTDNVRHFRRVDRLSVENWLRER